MANIESEWLTIAQVSKYLNISPAFLRKLVRRKAIPFARVGSKALRFLRSELDAWMAVNSGKTAGTSGSSKGSVDDKPEARR